MNDVTQGVLPDGNRMSRLRRRAFPAAIVLGFFCSLFARYALPYDFRIQYSISPLPLVVFVASFYLFKKFFSYLSAKKVSRRELAYFLIPAIYAAASFCFGAGVQGGTVDLEYSSSIFYAAILFITLLVHALIVCAYVSLKTTLAKAKAQSDLRFIRTGSEFWITVAILLLAWLPILLACYPGFLNYDAGSIWLGEWSQFESGQLNNHHSVLHTLILGNVIAFGEKITGSVNGGVAVFTIMQEVIAALVFSYILIG